MRLFRHSLEQRREGRNQKSDKRSVRPGHGDICRRLRYQFPSWSKRLILSVRSRSARLDPGPRSRHPRMDRCTRQLYLPCSPMGES